MHDQSSLLVDEYATLETITSRPKHMNFNQAILIFSISGVAGFNFAVTFVRYDYDSFLALLFHSSL